MMILGFDLPLVSTACCAITLWLLVKYANSGHDYFEKQGIPTARPLYPMVGNIWNIWKTDLRKRNEELLKKYGKIFGFFNGKTPVFMIADPDIIKSISVKHFDNFMNRPPFLSATEKFIRKTPLALIDQEWKDVRHAVTPVFSSGKIKMMSALMEECCETLVKVAEKRIHQGNGVVDLKELFGVYALDVIASCAFGTKLDNLDDPKNMFIEKSRDALRMNQSPLIMLMLMFRSWFLKLGVQFFPTETITFYVHLTMGIMRNRRLEHRKRGDVLDVMMEVMEADEKAMKADPTRNRIVTEEVVVAQSIAFFLAGFDTVGTTLTMAAYHLALNPHCQEKLLNEIQAALDRHEGKMNHDTATDCGYLEQVLNECLRMESPAIEIQRMCNSPCKIGNLQFQKGDLASIMVSAMHMSEENFPEPTKFDPERFSPENKGKIKPMTFLPFGAGPRKCIGMRLAYEEAKLALAYMVLAYKMVVCPETQVPYKNDPNILLVMPKDVKIKLEKRTA